MDQALPHVLLSDKTTVRPFIAPWSRFVLLFVLAYEALGGLAGGIMLVVAPDGHLMDMPVEIMNGVFADFLFPGILLSGMAALSAFAFLSVLRKKSSGQILSAITLAGWIIWFVTEIIILKELHWLHIMWAMPVLYGVVAGTPYFVSNGIKITTKGFMWCGVFSSFWYILVNILVPLYYEDYRIASYTVSELSAIGAPTRIMWVLMVLPYTLLFAAFGWGVRNASGNNGLLRVLGNMILIYSMFNFFWPPMHMRGAEPTLTDTLHITWAAVTVAMMITMMVCGAIVFKDRFRIFTFSALALLLVFGILTGLESPNIPVNGPTPFIGIWERMNIGVFMVWVIVLAFRLNRTVSSSRQ